MRPELIFGFSVAAITAACGGDGSFDPSGNWYVRAENQETIASSYLDATKNLSVEMSLADDPAVAGLAKTTATTATYDPSTNTFVLGALTVTLDPSTHAGKASQTVIEYPFPDYWGADGGIPDFSDTCRLTVTGDYAVQVTNDASHVHFTTVATIHFEQVKEGGKACQDFLTQEQRTAQSGDWANFFAAKAWVDAGALSLADLPTLTTISQTLTQDAARDQNSLSAQSFGGGGKPAPSTATFSLIKTSADVERLIAMVKACATPAR